MNNIDSRSPWKLTKSDTESAYFTDRKFSPIYTMLYFDHVSNIVMFIALFCNIVLFCTGQSFPVLFPVVMCNQSRYDLAWNVLCSLLGPKKLFCNIFCRYVNPINHEPYVQFKFLKLFWNPCTMFKPSYKITFYV